MTHSPRTVSFSNCKRLHLSLSTGALLFTYLWTMQTYNSSTNWKCKVTNKKKALGATIIYKHWAISSTPDGILWKLKDKTSSAWLKTSDYTMAWQIQQSLMHINNMQSRKCQQLSLDKNVKTELNAYMQWSLHLSWLQ